MILIISLLHPVIPSQQVSNKFQQEIVLIWEHSIYFFLMNYNHFRIYQATKALIKYLSELLNYISNNDLLIKVLEVVWQKMNYKLVFCVVTEYFVYVFQNNQCYFLHGSFFVTSQEFIRSFSKIMKLNYYFHCNFLHLTDFYSYSDSKTQFIKIIIKNVNKLKFTSISLNISTNLQIQSQGYLPQSLVQQIIKQITLLVFLNLKLNIQNMISSISKRQMNNIIRLSDFIFINQKRKLQLYILAPLLGMESAESSFKKENSKLNNFIIDKQTNSATYIPQNNNMLTVKTIKMNRDNSNGKGKGNYVTIQPQYYENSKNNYKLQTKQASILKFGQQKKYQANGQYFNSKILRENQIQNIKEQSIHRYGQRNLNERPNQIDNNYNAYTFKNIKLPDNKTNKQYFVVTDPNYHDNQPSMMKFQQSNNSEWSNNNLGSNLKGKKHNNIDEIEEGNYQPLQQSFHQLEDIKKAVRNCSQPKFKLCFQTDKFLISQKGNIHRYWMNNDAQNLKKIRTSKSVNNEQIIYQLSRRHQQQMDQLQKKNKDQVLRLKKKIQFINQNQSHKQNSQKNDSQNRSRVSQYLTPGYDHIIDQKTHNQQLSQKKMTPKFKSQSREQYYNRNKEINLNKKPFQAYISQIQSNKNYFLKVKSLIINDNNIEIGTMIQKYEKQLKITFYITPKKNIKLMEYQIEKNANLNINSFPERIWKWKSRKQQKITVTISILNFPYFLPQIKFYFEMQNNDLKQHYSIILPCSIHKFIQIDKIQKMDQLYLYKIITTGQQSINKTLLKKVQAIQSFLPGLTPIKKDSNEIIYLSSCSFKAIKFILKIQIILNINTPSIQVQTLYETNNEGIIQKINYIHAIISTLLSKSNKNKLKQ